MDRWGPKHVKLTYMMNKTQSLKNFVYLVGLHIYYKMIHGPYNIKLQKSFLPKSQQAIPECKLLPMFLWQQLLIC